MIKTAVKEILRFEGSNQLGNRITTERFELGGVRLPAGTPVTLCIGAAAPGWHWHGSRARSRFHVSWRGSLCTR